MKKKIIAVILSLSMTISLFSGCGSNTTEPTTETSATEISKTGESNISEIVSSKVTNGQSESPEKQFEGLTANEIYEFPIVLKTLQSSYSQEIIGGMEMAAEELGVIVNIQGPNNETKIEDQKNIINAASLSNPKGLGVSVADVEKAKETLMRCAEKGIPIVCFDTEIEDMQDTVVCTVTTDNQKVGEIAAEEMYAAIKNRIMNAESQIVIGELNQNTIDGSIQQRCSGFVNKMIELVKKDGKTIAVIGVEADKYIQMPTVDAEKADVIIEVTTPEQIGVESCAQAAKEILTKDHVIAVFCSGQMAAEGILQANEELDVLGTDILADDIICVGADLGSSTKTALDNGVFLGTVGTSSQMIGYYTVYALTAAANGWEVKDITLNASWYEAANK